MKVKTDAKGYAAAIYCKREHSGNHRYARVMRDMWACQGCGFFRDGTSIAAEQQALTQDTDREKV